MEVLSVYRGARISAFKARELTREIQGLAASAALDLITFSPKKAALLVGKTLKSAIANAENNNELKVETLVVKEATVGEGPTMKRSKSKARGSSSMIRKRTAHIRIVLSDEIELPKRKSPSKPGAKKKTNKPAATATKPAASIKTESAPKAEPLPATEAPKGPVDVETETKAQPATQADEGPGETAAAPKMSSDEDATKA